MRCTNVLSWNSTISIDGDNIVFNNRLTTRRLYSGITPIIDNTKWKQPINCGEIVQTWSWCHIVHICDGSWTWSSFYEAHEGISFRHKTRKERTTKVLNIGLWWLSLFQEAKKCCKHCDVYQCIGRPSLRDELPLFLFMVLESFEKWEINFIGTIFILLQKEWVQDTLSIQRNIWKDGKNPPRLIIIM